MSDEISESDDRSISGFDIVIYKLEPFFPALALGVVLALACGAGFYYVHHMRNELHDELKAAHQRISTQAKAKIETVNSEAIQKLQEAQQRVERVTQGR